MISMIESLLNTVTTLISFVISTIQSLFALFYYIPTYLEFVVSSLELLPDIVLPFCTAFIMLSVVQYIAGRKAE